MKNLKYVISYSLIVIALVQGVLAVLQKISPVWVIVAIILIGINKTALWYFTIPHHEEQERKWAEEGKQ